MKRTLSLTKFVRASFLAKLIAFGCLIAPSEAHAEPDTYGLGDGHDGALTVSAPNTIVNTYAPVTTTATAGATSVAVSSTTGFQIGQAILIWQTIGLTTSPAPGAAGPFDLAAEGAGRWEFSRITALDAATITIEAPLTRSYPAGVAQIVSVPEYTNVEIQAAASIVAKPWDGQTGGIVAFLATGNVVNAGSIRVDGRGLRGGAGGAAGTEVGCTALDEPSPRGATRGEGLVGSLWSTTGRGNVANGGGGGVCVASGGAGGGNISVGGAGGRSNDAARLVGGMPGGALDYGFDFATRLLLGGGGGGGAGKDVAGGGGGNGGGVVFLRAAALRGAGTIVAQGAAGANATAAGAGGGGAGGTIHVRLAGEMSCGTNTLLATGGIGGSSDGLRFGPGGGGGGGVIVAQGDSGACSLFAGSTSNGQQRDPAAPDGAGFGAGRGEANVVQRLAGGFSTPSPPVLLTPANGSTSSTTRPVITGMSSPWATIVFAIDGVEVGSTFANAAGNFTFTAPASLAEGPHEIRAAVELQHVRSKPTTVRITIDLAPPETTITSSPPALSNSTASTFAFSSEAAATFECSVDGGAFAPCTSPATFTMTEAPHTFAVRAKDAAGNVDPTPATHAWTIDLSAPSTDITEKPNAKTSATTATFGFTSELGATFQCKLDAAAFAPCTSPTSFNGLAEGSHTFSVRATDAAGNVAAIPASYSWQIDRTAPITTIVDKPANPTEATSATFVFTSEAEATFECKLDAAPAFTACTSPMTFDALAKGSHTFQVRATDDVGNVESSPPSHTWIIGTPIVDAGADASTPVDAGGDASAPADGGADAAPGDEDGGLDAGGEGGGEDTSGCGCKTTAPGPNAAHGLAFIGLGLATLLRRRRR